MPHPLLLSSGQHLLAQWKGQTVVTATGISGMVENDQNSILAPDLILASQFFGAIRRRGLPDGERRLMAAVLGDAVNCFLRNCGTADPRKRALYEEAEQWFLSADCKWLYSFENVCQVLGLDVDYLRRGLFGKCEAQRALAGAVEPEPAAESTACRQAC